MEFFCSEIFIMLLGIAETMADAKLIFLGTGGDATVIGKQIRGSGGIVLQADDTQLHIDPGPGTLVKAAEFGVPIRNTTAILVSNTSLYRCNDVQALIDALTISGLDRTGVLISCKELICGDEKGNRYLLDTYKEYVERFICLEPGNKVAINNVEIRALPVKHKSPSSIGFKILTSRFVLGYLGDTAYSAELVEELKDSDLLILNVMNPQDNKMPYTLCTEDAIKIINHVKPKLAIITGFGIKMINEDILEETRSIQRATGIQTLAAKDGMVINPLSYAVNLRQRTLNYY